MNTKKKSFNDTMFEFIEKYLGPIFGKLGESKLLSSITGGLMGIIGVLTIGSIFILIFGLATSYDFFAFLMPIAMPCLVGFQLTLGLTGLFVAAGVCASYAKLYKLDQLTGVVLGLAAFILLTSTVEDGSIAINNLGSQGMFVAILSSLATMTIYRICVEKNITIKMPEGVPPQIAATFAGLIPGFIALMLMWTIKSIMNFDTVSWIQSLLAPIFSAVDNIFTFTLRVFLGQTIWSVGMHADAIIGGITGPLTAQWIIENAEAFAAGASATQLPYIWTAPLMRMVGWTASVWGLMFWMFRSKAKNVRAVAWAGLPSAVFTIIEPILFGLPIVFNPYLLIPFVLSSTVAGFVTYGVMSLGLVSRFFVSLPWITPPPIQALLGTGGDWKMVLVVVVNTIIGILIYGPFFKAFEKNELAKEAAIKSKIE